MHRDVRGCGKQCQHGHVQAVRWHAVEFVRASRLDLILKLRDLSNGGLIWFVLNMIGATWFGPQRIYFKHCLVGHVAQKLVSLSDYHFDISSSVYIRHGRVQGQLGFLRLPNTG